MRVHHTTARCSSCGFLVQGELLDGFLCWRCEAGTLQNVALIHDDEVPWNSTDEERMGEA